MLEFCHGGAYGFSSEELEKVREAAWAAQHDLEGRKTRAEAEEDAARAQGVMGVGWTHVRLVLHAKMEAQGLYDEDAPGFCTLWEMPFDMAVFIPTGGYLRHLFVGPAKRHPTKVEAMCGNFLGTTLETVRVTFETICCPVRTSRLFDFSVCEKCRKSAAPYAFRWLPPQSDSA